MHRRSRVTGLFSFALATFVMVLAACIAGCGGAGDTYCSPDDTTCDLSPTPTDPPDTSGQSAPSECASQYQVYLIYPIVKSDLASYANTMYVSFTDAVNPSPYLAIALVFTQPGQTIPAGSELGTTIQYVNDPPDSVGAGLFGDLYSSSNLPLPPNRNVIVTLVDTRKPAKCPGVQLATIDTTTQSVQRLPAVRSVRPSASRVQALLRGGRL